ncbi:KUP/HAK/KT family potassium transporter, partial [Staphylococcus aureus]|nr:KUP/HAK/KT family potassium transporter [Staphylococcus aureus]
FVLMAPESFRPALIVLAGLATVIAAQAVITGAFSLTQQAIQLGFLPRLRVRQTSADFQGQIYLPAINWLLLFGVLVLVIDLALSPTRAKSPRNPWNAGTLEWLALPDDEDWGIRSVPLIESRYPIWDQKDFVAKVDAGRFFLPDAEEGRRETIVTSVLDAKPVSVIRLGGPSVKPMITA